jgi:undecaprenyl-diphosphatase
MTSSIPRSETSAELAAGGGPDAKVALLALGAVAALFVAVRQNQTAAIDLAIALRIQGRRSPAIAELMALVSRPGFAPHSRVIPPAIVSLLWIRGYRLEAGLQLAAWGTAVLADALKAITRRPRPLPADVEVVVARLGGSSFPSGHVLTYVGVYGFAAHLANSLIRPTWLRALTEAPLLGLVVLVGPSRVYLGHHWPTDVLASYLLGFAWLTGLTTLHIHLRRTARQ